MKTLKKLLCSLLACTFVLTSAVSCKEEVPNEENNQNEVVNNESDTIVITDHLGIEVTVPKNIERIVVGDLFPLASVLSVFFDSAEKIVGIPPQCMSAAKNSLLSELYPEILNAKTGYINGSNVNLEELLLLEPDVVFYSASSPAIGEQINNVGIPAVAISVTNWEYDAIETLNNWIALLSKMFEGNDKAELVKNYSENVFERVQDRIKDIPEEEKEKVFFLFQYNENMIATSGKHFFGQYWADATGAINVGHELDTDKATSITMEQVYDWNPDVILITNFNTATPESLYTNAVGSYDWSEIEAVKNKRVYKMPLGMYRSYTCGVDTPVTLLWVAKTIYPELFEDIDITAETRAFYKDVFGIELTDEQAEKIFKPASSAAAFN